MEELYQRWRSEGLTVLGVSIDDEARGVAEFAHTYGATFPVAWDHGHEVANRYRPQSDPTYYVIDRKGVIRFVNFGWHDGEQVEIARQVESLLR